MFFFPPQNPFLISVSQLTLNWLLLYSIVTVEYVLRWSLESKLVTPHKAPSVIITLPQEKRRPLEMLQEPQKVLSVVAANIAEKRVGISTLP